MTDSPAGTTRVVANRHAPHVRARRLQALQVFIVAAGVLVLAVAMTPDSRGFGTHQHLLLPPCIFRTITHAPCPFCGLTTGFTLMARGRVVEAAGCNLMAPPAFAVTVLAALLALWGLTTGRQWAPSFVFDRGLPRIVVYIIGAFWIVNLVWFLYNGT